MDHLRLDLGPARFGSHASRTVRIVVNGTPLVDHAKSVEAPFANAEGKPNLAGDYAPLLVEDFRSRQGLLGNPVSTWFEDGDTVLMGCPCGEWGCWPLTAMIDVKDDRVTWRRFRNGHRDWDLSALGPFVFERIQYETAVAVLG